MLYENVDKETFASEREILYKILFDLRNDVNDMKKLVLDIMQKGKSSEEIQEGPHDPGLRSVPYGDKVHGGHFAGGSSPGTEAESGATDKRQGIKGTADALWCVQHYPRWKADCGASGQRNEIHEHHD